MVSVQVKVMTCRHLYVKLVDEVSVPETNQV